MPLHLLPRLHLTLRSLPERRDVNIGLGLGYVPKSLLRAASDRKLFRSRSILFILKPPGTEGFVCLFGYPSRWRSLTSLTERLIQATKPKRKKQRKIVHSCRRGVIQKRLACRAVDELRNKPDGQVRYVLSLRCEEVLIIFIDG